MAEDTRVTAKLLAIHGISRPFLSYNDHNAPAMRPKLIRRLKEGARLALVSDAGTPLVSDPGHKLVREAREAGIAVYPVPGASALLAGLTASGLPSDRFLFAGFLPVKQGARHTALMELRAVPATLVFYESARRLGETLAAMAEVFGPREAAVARELTKLHEEIRNGSLPELAEAFAGAPPKGEITLIVSPPAEEVPETDRIDRVLKLALPHMPVSSAARLAAEILGAPRRETYERALAISEHPDAPDTEK